MKDIPIYDITIEDDAEIQGVSKISLVDVPAIGVNWIALRKVELKLQDVFGYETQHFDICPGAQATFANYSQMQLDEDTIGMVRSAAQVADNVFEIEKKVIEAGRATSEDLQQVKTLVDDFKDIISEIDKITGQPQQVDYMDGHIQKVQELIPSMMKAFRKPKMIIAKPECFGCPPNGDGTRVDGEPDGRCRIGDGPEPSGSSGKNAAGQKVTQNPIVAAVSVDYNDLEGMADPRDRYFLKEPGEYRTSELELQIATSDGTTFDGRYLLGEDGKILTYSDPEAEGFVTGEDPVWNADFEKALTEDASAPMPDFYEAMAWQPDFNPEDLDPNNPEQAGDYALYESIKQAIPDDGQYDKETLDQLRFEQFSQEKYNEFTQLYNKSLDAWENEKVGLLQEGQFVVSNDPTSAIAVDPEFGGERPELMTLSPDLAKDLGGPSETFQNMLSNVEPNVEILNDQGDYITMPQSVAQRIYIGHETTFSKGRGDTFLYYQTTKGEAAHGLNNLGSVRGFRMGSDGQMQVAYAVQATGKDGRVRTGLIYKDIFGPKHRRPYSDMERTDYENPILQPRWSQVPTGPASFL